MKTVLEHFSGGTEMMVSPVFGDCQSLGLDLVSLSVR
jgi:hypothetical protein